MNPSSRRPLVLSLLLVAGLLANGVVAAADVQCNVHSDYELALNQRSLILTRDHGSPRALVLRQGRLFVDDAWVDLSDSDSRRIAAFERDTRAAMPEAQAIGRAAADIAFVALGEVAAGFSSDPAAVRAKLGQARSQLDARLARSVSPTRFDGRDLGAGIGAAVGAVMPSLLGDIVGGAISAAFGGDPQRLKRMENIDAQVEAAVKPRAAALEVRADALCRRLVALDALDNALEYRHRGQPLQLIELDDPHAEPGVPPAAGAAPVRHDAGR